MLPREENEQKKNKRNLSPFSASATNLSPKKFGAQVLDDDDYEDEEDDAIVPFGAHANVPFGVTKPLCMYGVNCYRKNPQHFVDFAHPHLDNNN